MSGAGITVDILTGKNPKDSIREISSSINDMIAELH
jgi:hypothetical protein